jgi:hypothetical protein
VRTPLAYLLQRVLRAKSAPACRPPREPAHSPLPFDRSLCYRSRTE